MEAGKTSQKRVTLRDVAQEAGVSLKTASNVINGTGRMSDATRQKVQDVVQRLDYRVNVAARNLNRGKTGAITLAVPTLTAPYLAELANRIIDEARQRNYQVYVVTYGEGSAKDARKLLQLFNATVCDGMIFSMSEVVDITPDDLDVDFPLVVVGARTTWNKADHITPDDVQAAHDATQFLFEHGSQRIAVIGAHRAYDEAKLTQAMEGNAELRLRGIIEAHREQGLTLNPELVGVTGQDWSIGAGAKTTQQLIDSGTPFDGVIALNDQLAIGAVSALTASGIAIPNQVQVIGFDNIEEAAYLQIPLTTVDSCLEWVSGSAVDRIIRRIQGENLIPELIQCSAHVIARQTTR